MRNEENCEKKLDQSFGGDLAVQVLVKLLHDLLESLQVVLHIVLGHDQAQVELGEGRLQKLVVHLPDKMFM